MTLTGLLITLAGGIIVALMWLAALVIHSTCRAVGEGVTSLPIPDETGPIVLA